MHRSYSSIDVAAISAYLLSPRSSTTRTPSSSGNTKQFEQTCFACNEIHPCNSNAYSEGELGVCELNSAGDCLMDAANAIGEPNTLNLLTENLKDVIKQKSYEEILNNFIKRLEQSIVYRSNSSLLNELLQD